MQWIEVPRTLDAPARFLFWDFDYVMVASVGLVMGLMISGVTAGLVATVGLTWLWRRLRAGSGVDRVLALLYWHLPMDIFNRLPVSSRRHFLG